MRGKGRLEELVGHLAARQLLERSAEKAKKKSARRKCQVRRSCLISPNGDLHIISAPSSAPERRLDAGGGATSALHLRPATPNSQPKSLCGSLVCGPRHRTRPTARDEPQLFAWQPREWKGGAKQADHALADGREGSTNHFCLSPPLWQPHEWKESPKKADLVEQCMDSILFGCMPRCAECGHRLRYGDRPDYVCPGSPWMKCDGVRDTSGDEHVRCTFTTPLASGGMQRTHWRWD